MKRILIVGGGGFGLELYWYLSSDIASGRLSGFAIGGVLEDNAECELVIKVPEAQFLGSVEEYQVAGDEVVAIAIGSPARRLKVAGEMREKGMPLFTYIHSSVLVAPSAQVGLGAIVCPNSIINADARVEENVAVNVFCSIGHGARVGAHSVLSPFTAISGDAELGECCLTGTRATLFPKVVVGARSIVDSHSRVKKSVNGGTVVSERGKYLELPNRLGA